MKRILILLVAVSLVIGLSHHACAHPGHGYYLEEPSDSGDSDSDSSTTTSPAPTKKTSDRSSTGSGTKTSKSPSGGVETGSAQGEAADVSAQNKTDIQGQDGNESTPSGNITGKEKQGTSGYGFIPAVAGLSLVFGLTALRFPRQ
jgi:hypothetical protein